MHAAVVPCGAQRRAPVDRAIISLPDCRTLDALLRAVTPGPGGETRSATAVLDVTGSLQPGLAVRVRLLPSRGEVLDAIVISEDALQSLEGRDVVFVRTNQGFRAQKVTIGRRRAGGVDVLSGLKTGPGSEERRARKEWGRQCRFRWAP